MNNERVQLNARIVDGSLIIPTSIVAVARRLRQECSLSEQFLLESGSNRSIDSQQSILGLGVLLCVEVAEGQVSLSGDTRFTNIVESYLLGRDLIAMGLVEAIDLIRAIEEGIEVLSANGATDKPPLLVTLGYDIAAPKASTESAILTPDLIIILPSTIVSVDHWNDTYSAVTLLDNASEATKHLDTIQAVLRTAADPVFYPATVADAAPIHMTVTANQYLYNAEQCLEYIRAGDIYQIQLGHEVVVTSSEDPFVLYTRLRKSNPSPYMFLVFTASVALVGASPELFVRVENRLIQMRPLAGTLPKTGNSTGTKSLESDPKEQAEHIMLVDLCRNDIGRVAEFGSMQVPQLMAVEDFPSLFHLVSTITGRLKANLDVWDVIEACSPAGTMTGCPKIRATEIIAEQEWTRRGLYSGSIIFSNGRGNLTSALIIRSLIAREGKISIRASAGIVAYSDLEKEWNETLAKIRSSLPAATSEKLSDILFG